MSGFFTGENPDAERPLHLTSFERMPDGAVITIFMTNEITTETAKVEETADTTAKDVSTEEETKVETKEETEKTEVSNIENEIDYDAEIEKERKGKPDPIKAREAFKGRKERREEKQEDEGEEEVDEEDKPLTRREMQELLAHDRKERELDSALHIAQSLAGSEKEAQLIVAKWQNRTFPSHLTLREQLEESYAITHSKKLIGERNELMRALKNKGNVNTNAAGTHQDAPKGKEPELASQDKQALAASGFIWNAVSRQYEKKLSNGDLLVRDSKTKQTRLVKRKS